MSRSVIITAALLAAGAVPLGAQDPVVQAARAPYSSVTVTLSLAQQASSGRLDDYWNAGTGARIAIHTPFHIGEAGLTATTLRYESRGAGQPGFRNITVGAAWRFPIVVSPRVRPALSIEAGNYMMIFDGEQPKGLGRENEIYAGAGASVGVAVTGHTAAVIGADARHVWTSTAIRTLSLHAGIAHTFGTPGWLRAVVE